MRGICVMGAGRSGTSALTRIINMLGVPTCLESDLLAVRPANPKGFWESQTVTIGDEILFALADGMWSCPPSSDEILAATTPRMLDAYGRGFRLVHPTEEWVLKDPRLCFTLPFWSKALSVAPVVVLAVRRPDEVAASGGRRAKIKPEQALALWERSTRAVLRECAGLPTIVAPVHEILSRPHQWCEITSDFLQKHGFTLSTPTWCEHLDQFIDLSLLHTEVQELPLSREQAALLDRAKCLAGHHDSLPTSPLPEETPETDELLCGLRHRLKSLGFPEPGSGRLLGVPLNGALGEMYSAAAEAYAEKMPRSSESRGSGR